MGRSRMTTGLLALILMIFNAAVVAWMIWAFRDPTSGYGAGYVGLFVAILTVLGAILGVSSLVDKSGRVPGAKPTEATPIMEGGALNGGNATSHDGSE